MRSHLHPARSLIIDESSIPMDETVAAAVEMLGINPLHAANEGNIVAVEARSYQTVPFSSCGTVRSLPGQQ